MKLAIMQPYFFPYLGYFQLIRAVDRFILYDQVNYIRQGWVNRNRLLLPNGHPAFFTVPVRAQSSYRKIRDVEIDNGSLWHKRTRKQFAMNYRRAPFFEEVYPLLERCLEGKEDSLARLNGASIVAVCEFLGIATAVETDTTQYEALEAELSRDGSEVRNRYAREQQLGCTRTIRVLEICKKEDAETYVNATGGRSLYDKPTFSRNGINLCFIQPLPCPYQQRSSQFFPDLSIVDVLMNCGRNGTREMLDSYEMG